MGDILDKLGDKETTPEENKEPEEIKETESDYMSDDSLDYSEEEHGTFLKKDRSIYLCVAGIQGFLLSLLFLRDFAEIDPVAVSVSVFGAALFLHNANFISIYAFFRKLTMKKIEDTEDDKIKVIVTNWETSPENSSSVEWNTKNII